MNRAFQRRSVGAFGLSICWIPSCGCGRARGDIFEHGCDVAPADAPAYFSRSTRAEVFSEGVEKLEPRSDDPVLDRALAQGLFLVGRAFQVLPSFSYFTGPDEKNARATSQSNPTRQTNGAVFFGLKFLHDLKSHPISPAAAIMSIIAHEFGHIVAYRRGFHSQLGSGPIKMLAARPEA